MKQSILVFLAILLNQNRSKVIWEGQYTTPREIYGMSGGIEHFSTIERQNNGSFSLYYINLTDGETQLQNYQDSFIGISEVPSSSSLATSSHILKGPSGFWFRNGASSIIHSWLIGNETNSFEDIDQMGVYLCRVKYFSSNSSSFIQVFNSTSSSITVSSSLMGLQALKVRISNQKIYVLFKQLSGAFNTLIKIFSFSANLQYTITESFQTLSVKMDVSKGYVCLGFDTTIFIYNSSANYTKFQMISLPANVQGLATNGDWLLTVVATQYILQYQVATGELFGTELENDTQIFFYQQKSVLKAGSHKIGAQVCCKFNVTNVYTCPGGCSACRSGYSLNNDNECDGGLTYTPPLPSPPILPPITSNITNTTNIHNALLVPSLSQPFSTCFRVQHDYCVQFCPERCQLCSNELKSICLVCSENYHLDLQGNCQINQAIFFVAYFFSLASLVRNRGLEIILFALSNLQLYDFHQNNYDGILNRIFLTIRFIKEKQWQLIPINKVVDWFDGDGEFNGFPNYNPFTNKKFFKVQRKNSIFFTNTLDYFLLYLPILALTFFLFNRLFYLTFNSRISIIFRTYSLKLYLVGLFLFSDYQLVTFLSIRNFQELFSFDSASSYLFALQITIIGLLFIGSMSMSFLYRYFYGALCRYFLTNMSPIPLSQIIMMVFFAFRPICLATVHALTYHSSFFQLILLSSIQISSFLAMAGIQLSTNLYRVKIIFCLELLLALQMFALNNLIHFKYNIQNSTQICQKFQEAITVVVYLEALTLILVFLIACIIHPILDIFKGGNAQQSPAKRSLKAIQYQYTTTNIGNNIGKQIQKITIFPKKHILITGQKQKIQQSSSLEPVIQNPQIERPVLKGKQKAHKTQIIGKESTKKYNQKQEVRIRKLLVIFKLERHELTQFGRNTIQKYSKQEK